MRGLTQRSNPPNLMLHHLITRHQFFVFERMNKVSTDYLLYFLTILANMYGAIYCHIYHIQFFFLGIRTRNRWCVVKDDQSPVDASACGGPPEETEPCNTQPCEAK